MTLLRKWPWRALLLVLFVVSVSAGRANAIRPMDFTTNFLKEQSLALNGDGYVRVPDHPELNPTDAISIEAWVWRDDAARCETVVGKDYIESYWLGFCHSAIRFYTAGSGTAVDGVASIPEKTWTHIAVTYDGVTRRYYVNGELDLESTAFNGPLTDSGADLGIGFDPDTSFVHNYFDGFIDEVRIWNRVRTQAEIQADMRREISDIPTGLIAYWRLNGAAQDYGIGGHLDDGDLVGNATFTARGVLPREMQIGRHDATVSLDGQCDATEYDLASVEQSGFATVYLQHNDDDLYVCFGGLEQGPGHAAHVLFDIDASQSDPVDSGDYRFTLDIDGNTTAEEGNGGSFTSFTPPSGAWNAARHVDFEFTWSAEFRFSRTLLQMLTDWGEDLGLGLVEDRAAKPDFSWPGALIETQPSTWGRATVSNDANVSRTFDFEGYVLDEATGEGLAGSTIQIFASTPAGTDLLDTVVTDGDGKYTFSHTTTLPMTFLLQQEDLTGYSSVSAAVGDDGGVVTPNVVRYDRVEEDHTYTEATFLDTSGRPMPRAFDRHYLIVYSPPVNYADLWALIEMKQLQGFQVTAETVQNIEASTSGYDRAEKIRNWLRTQWQTHDPEPIYALLIGDSDVIPERQVGWEGDNAHRDPEEIPAFATDWYYADLDSDDWDADGDGYYGEFLYCKPGEYKVPVAGADLPARCPEEGSPLREGGYGADPGPEDDWVAEISIGRIMLNDRVEVRHALKSIVETEASGDLAKREAMLAGAMWFYFGNSWDAEAGSYKIGEGPYLIDAWPEDGEPPYGNDAAEPLEVQVRPEIETYMDVFALYEGIAPNDDPDLIPTARPFDLPLSLDNVKDTLNAQDYGLVNVAGHGNAYGVYHDSWVQDYNDNGRIENPVNPDEAPGCTVACREIGGGGTFLNSSTFPWPDSVAPVYFANACSTGDWIAGRDNLASRMLARGRAAAWMGALSTVPVNGVDAFQRDFNRDIVAGGKLLGDAAWGLSGTRHRTRWVYDWRMGTMQLFGDPAYSYWGNPADALAGWPQLGNDWWASGYTQHAGPGSAGRVWHADDHTPLSPPVVDRDGYVVVGAQGHLAKFDPEGELVDSVNLGAHVSYAPAVTTDSIYVVSGGTLYHYDHNLDLREQISLGGLVNDAPRVGPNGTVWVPTTLGMARITGAGLPVILSSEGAVTGSAAFMTHGTVWTTENGLYALYETGGSVSVGVSKEIPDVALTSPAVGDDEIIFVGGGNGRLYAFDDLNDPALWTFDADGAILERPAVGPDNTAYIGTNQGNVYAVRNGSVIWQRDLGPAVLASPALDNSHLYVTAGSTLHALSLGTGATLWSVSLGGGTDDRSTPVVVNQEVYVTRVDGVLVGISEERFLLPPSDVVVRAQDNQVGNVQVRWLDNSDNETSFNLEVCQINGTCSSWMTASANVTETVLSQLPTGIPFYVRVQALGDFGDGMQLAATSGYNSEYGYSESVVALPASPQIPTNLTATAISAEEIALSWTYGGSDAELLGGFNVYRSESPGGPYTLAGSTAPSTLAFTDPNLAANTTYHYRVTAMNDGGESDDSASANATTKAFSLAAPTGLTAIQQSDNSVVLDWTDNATGETGYVVLQKLAGEGGFTVIATLPADATEHTVPYYQVSEGQVTYQVKAVNEAAESQPDMAVLDYAVSRDHTVFLPLTLRQ